MFSKEVTLGFSPKKTNICTCSKGYTKAYSMLGSPGSLLCPELWAPRNKWG